MKGTGRNIALDWSIAILLLKGASRGGFLHHPVGEADCVLCLRLGRHLAVDETVSLLAPPSTFSRYINRNVERERQQNDRTLVNGCRHHALPALRPAALADKRVHQMVVRGKVDCPRGPPTAKQLSSAAAHHGCVCDTPPRAAGHTCYHRTTEPQKCGLVVASMWRGRSGSRLTLPVVGAGAVLGLDEDLSAVAQLPHLLVVRGRVRDHVAAQPSTHGRVTAVSHTHPCSLMGS